MFTFAAGCIGSMPSTTTSSGNAPPDESAVLADVMNGAYRNAAAFALVNSAPYASALAATNTINVYVTASALDDYEHISPDATNSGGSVPAGTVLVREVLDGSGSLTKLTLMVKGPAGYNPSVGDFWFGVTTPAGTPMVENGSTDMGKLTQCFGCHQQRASDGFLFGVPAAHRRGAGVADGGVGGVGDGGASDGGAPGGPPDMGCHPHHNHGCADMSM